VKSAETLSKLIFTVSCIWRNSFNLKIRFSLNIYC